MSDRTLEQGRPSRSQGIWAGLRLPALPVFTATLLLSAFLLFWVQPLFGKLVLPLLGGAPGVWITAMLFFQAALLAGYCYAHLVSRCLAPRWQVLVHLAVLGLGAFSLPLAVADLTPDSSGHPAAWLILLLGLSIGLPFFALSATAPLLQSWFSKTGHAHASDPYFLYAASNIGSLVALLGYPFVLEPSLRLGQQGLLWTWGYLLLFAATLTCGLVLAQALVINRRQDLAQESAAPLVGEAASLAPTARQRALWVLLAFAPTSLMLGVTTHITTDIAASPLFWVLPLSLFLLTFIITFARRPILRHRWLVVAQPYLLVLGLLLPLLVPKILAVMASELLLIFFVAALVCHGELVRRRPAAAYLTEFYLWMALGGVLGGLFNAIVAPLVFVAPYEYAIALGLCCLLRPGKSASPPGTLARDLLYPLALLFALLGPLWLFGFDPKTLGPEPYFIYLVVLYIVIFGFKDRPLRFGLGLMVVLLATQQFPGEAQVLERDRSFFGVYKVEQQNQKGAAAQVLHHGRTFHGAQLVEPTERRQPLAYYTQDGPLGQTFAALAAQRPPQRIGLVGLGIGSVLSYRQEGQDWWLYEIDPLVAELARDRRYFDYLADAEQDPQVRLVLGDARLSLQDADNASFDLLIVDAFTSDAIPVHLMTLEAIDLYRRKLSAQGVLLIHISNRHLDLTQVLRPIAKRLDLAILEQNHRPKGADSPPFHFASRWLALAHSPDSLRPLRELGPWEDLSPRADDVLWTDDFSNILSVLK